MLRLLAVIVLITFAVFDLSDPLHAQTLLSPEEAAVQLKPYVLTDADAPTGYAVGAPAVTTPAGLAYQDTAHLGHAASLRAWEHGGLLAQVQQALSPTTAVRADYAPPTLAITLFRTIEEADAFVNEPLHDTATQQVAPIPSALGAAWSFTPIDGPLDEANNLILWHRGLVAFSLAARAYEAAGLATAIDAVEVGQPAVVLGTPTVTPPGTEEDRLNAGLRLAAITPPVLPDGYVLAARGYQIGDAYVIGSADPVARLHEVDES